MPTISSGYTSKGPGDFRVLITGFGHFGPYKVNPSWLAVKPLHNLILETSNSTPPKSIHITTFMVPVTYKDVLEIIPQLHARPPHLPSTVTDAPPPPPEGYDLILHVGVAPPDLCRVESQGHKSGYRLKDADGELAPIIGEYSTLEESTLSKEEEAERERLGEHQKQTKGRKLRGFGKGYEEFDEVLVSDLDASEIVDRLKLAGCDYARLSNDAGRYLCDFIYYCSLAEQRRTDNKGGIKSKNTKVLFLHCPPIDQPLSTEQVTECIQKLVIIVCDKLASSSDHI